MAVQKVFGIGLSKTGTTTLAKMMQRLGYMNLNYDRYYLRLIKQNRIDELWKFIDRWQSFQDIPWPLIYRELDQHYPGSKFILTIRDEEKWWKSLIKHLGGEDREDTYLVYGKRDPVGHRDLFMSIYQAHNTEVQEYFAGRPNDLLVVDWERQGVKEICSFLGRKIPVNRITGKEIATGHYNKAEQRARRGRLAIFFRTKIKRPLKHAIFQIFGMHALTFLNGLRYVRYWVRKQFLSAKYSAA